MSLERVSANCASGHTADDWVSAVQRSVETMREDLGGEHSLRSLARSAWLSPFHFHRIFMKVTDTTPARFLAAWRMAEAKRMLAHSSASVTDICMQMGYSSLGTFTSQFTRTVGMPPGRFRRLLDAQPDRPFNDLLRDLGQSWAVPSAPQLSVTVTGGPMAVPAVVGLFRTGIPQERPTACAFVDVPGRAVLAGISEGPHYPLVMSFDESVTVVEAVAGGDLDRCYVGAGDVTSALAIREATDSTVGVKLRGRRATDPPIVLALPLLLAAADRGQTAS
jgi:AraC family transcriptional regulator